MTAFRPLSALTPQERDRIRDFVAERGIVALYLDTALEDLARGIDNRLVLTGGAGAGVILGIRFSGLEVFTVIGMLDDAELASVLVRRMPAELHVPEPVAARLRPHLGARIISAEDMRIETCAIGLARVRDPDCRVLSADDAARLTAFYAAHNPRSVFSPWMLAHPLVAVLEGDEIVAAAGVLALSRRLGWAMIGNFLTHPDRRGCGLAARVGETLLAELRTIGLRTAALATTDRNQAARRVYQRLGFTLAERWIELDLAAIK